MEKEANTQRRIGLPLIGKLDLERLSTGLGIASALATVLTVLLTIGISIYGWGKGPRQDLAPADGNYATEAELEAVSHDAAQMLAELRDLEQAVSKADGSNSREGQLAIAQLEATTERLSTRLTRIENAVLESPERALSLPLMRRDLKNLEEGHQRDLAAAREDYKQLFDLFKWFVGLIGTMALGLLGMASSNALQGRRRK